MAPGWCCATTALPAAARAQIDEMLRGAGLRVTRQRQAIAEVLLRAADHPDAEAVLDRARRIDPSVSQATTYRTLATLTDKGFLRQHRFAGQRARHRTRGDPGSGGSFSGP